MLSDGQFDAREPEFERSVDRAPDEPATDASPPEIWKQTNTELASMRKARPSDMRLDLAPAHDAVFAGRNEIGTSSLDRRKEKLSHSLGSGRLGERKKYPLPSYVIDRLMEAIDMTFIQQNNSNIHATTCGVGGRLLPAAEANSSRGASALLNRPLNRQL
jgi:hypothetical protein